MVIFGTDSTSQRGCFIAFTKDTSPSRGSVLELPQGAGGGTLKLPEPSDITYPLIVTSIDISQIERIFYLKCFNNRVYSYTFGNDIGSIKVNFLGFLVTGTTVGDTGSAGLESGIARDVLNGYEQARASVSRKFATLSFGGIGPGKVSLRGLVKGMNSNTSNVETNIQAFSFNLDVVEAQSV